MSQKTKRGFRKRLIYYVPLKENESRRLNVHTFELFFCDKYFLALTFGTCHIRHKNPATSPICFDNRYWLIEGPFYFAKSEAQEIKVLMRDCAHMRLCAQQLLLHTYQLSSRNKAL